MFLFADESKLAAAYPVDHEWVSGKGELVRSILSEYRIAPSKDFAADVSARQRTCARLLILTGGRAAQPCERAKPPP
jgi:hypothetical protein